MSVKVIEIVQVLVDRVHQNGYQLRAVEDDIYAEKEKRAAAEKDRDHWRQARQDAMQAGELMQAEIERLRGAMASDDQRLRDAEERVWPGETRGCDAPDLMADEILGLRQQLDAARAETVEARRRLDEETDRHRATNAEKIELFQQKEWANQHAAELVRERDAALATVDLQRAGIERLNAFVGEVRNADCYLEVLQALAELNAGTSEPAPATEPAPCPECERLQSERKVLTVEQQQDAEICQQQLDVAQAEVQYLRERLDEERSVSARFLRKLAALAANPSATPAGSPEPEGGK